MRTVDERLVRASIPRIFALARDVERWPALLAHYRTVRFRERSDDRGGIVEMAADRPFGPVRWPTWWLCEMRVDVARPAIRFRHIGGITAGMDVEWSFERSATADERGTRVRILHVWDGPRWPGIGRFAATLVIGPVFIHGIASRTLAGLAAAAEQQVSRGRNGSDAS